MLFYYAGNALNSAVSVGNKELVNELLRRGLNPNITSSSGWLPINLAIFNGNIDILNSLINHGANPNTPNDVRHFYMSHFLSP